MQNALLPPGLFAFREATVKRVVSADPIANAEFSLTVPAGKAWLLQSVTAVLVQGITNTPQPLLQITDGSNILFESIGSTTAQAVSTTCRYTWSNSLLLSGQIGATVDVHATGSLPENLVLPAGYVITSKTLGLAATADWGIASALVVEYSN